ncbi:hypothetical protein B0H11DRAFT_2006831 [Mycena galericulata]|nr:hypothetical protein B0H11DRAFT_2006831 [Mycena galericulata]
MPGYLLAGMTQPSLARKTSGFLAFWKKPHPKSPIPDKAPLTESDIVLPTEIWLDILDYFPEHTLEPVSRVCKRLRWVTLPLFFRSQQVFPFMETFAFRRLSMNVEIAGYQERSLRRLEFLSTTRISPEVRDLYVSPYPPGYNRRHRVEHKPVEAVMEPLLNALPKFFNLNKLVLHFPLCDENLISSLKSLRLDYLELEMLPTTRGDVPIPARKEFLFNRSTSPIQMFPPDSLSLVLLFPNSIERIVAGPTGTDALVRTLIQHPAGLPSLQTLDISLRVAASPDLAEALTACPQLTALRLRASALDGPHIPAHLPSLPASALPHLNSYHGPASFAPALARGRPLRFVRLWTSHGVSAICAPVLLLPALRQLDAPAGVAGIFHLELGVTTVSPALLATLQQACPALAVLAVNAHLDAFHPGSVERHVLSLATSDGECSARLRLPRGWGLRTLRLGVQLAGSSPVHSPEHAALFASAREAVAGFPGAYDPTSWRRWVVDAPWYCVEWTRSSVGAVDLDADVCADVRAEASVGAGARAGVDVDSDADMQTYEEVKGTLSIEYGEHYFNSFERGSRISARSVDEAIMRMS